MNARAGNSLISKAAGGGQRGGVHRSSGPVDGGAPLTREPGRCAG
jgi:hypothetical protein